MKERQVIKIRDYGPKLFELGEMSLPINDRLISVVFTEEENLFEIKYFELKESGRSELGGCVGPTIIDTFLSLDNVVQNAVVSKLMHLERGFGVK